jgi:putative tryptophan/tyrosine transport system substrate-binding protein
VTQLYVEVMPKRLELAHELVPTATIIAALVNPTNPNTETILRDLQAAARILGVQLQVLHASTERDLDTVFATLAQLRAGALVIGPDAIFNGWAEQLAALTVHHAVPAIFERRAFAAAGGLMSYGGNTEESYRQAGCLHRPDSQGREARRPASPSVHESGTDQPPRARLREAAV